MGPGIHAAISTTRRVIRFDSAGIGRSEGTVPETVHGVATVAADFIKRLGLSKLDILGWSLVGVVAKFALDFPHLVRR